MSETIKSEAGAPAHPSPGEIGAGARVLKEVIKTPAFREILNLYLRESDPKAARDLVRTLMEEDANLSLSLVAASPGLINALAEALLEIARQLKRFPPELLDSYAGQVLDGINTATLREVPEAWGPLLVKALPEMIGTKARFLQALASSLLALEPKDRIDLINHAIRGIDGEAIAQATNAFSQIMQTLAREQSNLPEELRPVLEEAIDETDFGKLREALTYLATVETDVLICFLEPVFANPIVVANLVGLIAPLLNNGLRLSSYALENIGMPGELIASSLFNILSDVDQAELGKTLTAGSKLITDMHEGNYILGNGEPRFRSVFSDFAAGTLENTDAGQVVDAVTALAEDLEVAFGVLTDLLIRHPDLLSRIVAADARILNLMVRSGTHIVAALSQLPQERLAEIGAVFAKDFDRNELARLVNAFLVFRGNFLKANPDFCLLDGVVEDIDLELLGRELQQSTARVTTAVLDAPNVKSALEPERIGKTINGFLVRFNKRMEERGPSDGNYVTRLAGQIDSKELEKALRNGFGLVRQVLFASTKRGMAILRPVFAEGRHLVRFLLGAVKSRLLGPRDGGQ